MSEPTYSADWFSDRIPFLAHVLTPWVGRPGVQMLEIGCYEGLSTNWFLDNILTGAGASIVCVDTFGGSAEHAGIDLNDLHKRFLANTAHIAGRREVYHQRSDEFCMEQEPDQYDIIYVDGSHAVEDILLDALLGWRLLKVDGIMVFDDYSWGHQIAESLRPKVAIDAFVHAYEPRLRVVAHDYQYAVRKIS